MKLPYATVWLSFLRSYEGMGTANVSCSSGCRCAPSFLDGTWSRQVSLQQIHLIRVRVSLWRGGKLVCPHNIWSRN